MVVSSRRAIAGASGVFLTVGPEILLMAHGTTARLKRPGTMAANAQLPHVTSTPISTAACCATGLPAMAVTNIADVTTLTCEAVNVR